MAVVALIDGVVVVLRVDRCRPLLSCGNGTPMARRGPGGAGVERQVGLIGYVCLVRRRGGGAAPIDGLGRA